MLLECSKYLKLMLKLEVVVGLQGFVIVSDVDSLMIDCVRDPCDDLLSFCLCILAYESFLEVNMPVVLLLW